MINHDELQDSNRERWRLYAHDLHQARLWTALVLGVPGGVDQGVHGQSLVWMILTCDIRSLLQLKLSILIKVLLVCVSVCLSVRYHFSIN